MNFRELRFARAMEFTIHEINNRTDLLPGITLGYQIHDTCFEVLMAMKVAFQYANGMELIFNDTDSCSKSAAAAVPALVGETSSTLSMSMSRVLGLFGIPQVSHKATCACLSNKYQFPNFFRAIPSDHHQAAALATIVKRFGWTWIGAVRSDTDYGNYGMASFLKAAQDLGICVEYSEVFYRTQPRSKVERVANVIRRSTARVIVAFVHDSELRLLLEELVKQPPPPLQWIGSEAWIMDPSFLRFNMCAGAIGFGIPRSVIPGLREFLLDLSPEQALKSPLLTEFWESSFSCSLKGSSEGARECDGSEDIRALQNPYTDTSQLRITNLVYKATCAIAHAIHGVICNDTQCDKSAKFTSRQPPINHHSGPKTENMQTNITMETSLLGEIITALSLLQQTQHPMGKPGPLLHHGLGPSNKQEAYVELGDGNQYSSHHFYFTGHPRSVCGLEVVKEELDSPTTFPAHG
ncbi:hypothetical protein SRHO_G00078290 [Serrasalmus rhombeus]